MLNIPISLLDYYFKYIFLKCTRPFIFEPTFFERDSYIVQLMSGRKLIPFGQRKAESCSADTHLASLGVKKLGTAFWIFLQKMGLSVDNPYFYFYNLSIISSNSLFASTSFSGLTVDVCKHLTYPLTLTLSPISIILIVFSASAELTTESPPPTTTT